MQADRSSVLALGALALATLAALATALSGPGYRLGWWDLRDGFELLRWGAYGGLGAAAVSVLALAHARFARRRGASVAALGLVLGLLAVGVPWSHMRIARTVPPIHDITTNIDDPPLFVAVLPLRRDAPNPATYGGPEIAAQQREAYPDLRTLELAAPPEDVARQALEVARALGWEIVEAAPTEGRIEATDTTFWFGFKDDVVIRVQASGGGSAVDLRSVSRVGRGDVGANAARIRAFVEALERRLAQTT